MAITIPLKFDPSTGFLDGESIIQLLRKSLPKRNTMLVWTSVDNESGLHRHDVGQFLIVSQTGAYESLVNFLCERPYYRVVGFEKTDENDLIVELLTSGSESVSRDFLEIVNFPKKELSKGEIFLRAQIA